MKFERSLFKKNDQVNQTLSCLSKPLVDIQPYRLSPLMPSENWSGVVSSVHKESKDEATWYYREWEWHKCRGSIFREKVIGRACIYLSIQFLCHLSRGFIHPCSQCSLRKSNSNKNGEQKIITKSEEVYNRCLQERCLQYLSPAWAILFWLFFPQQTYIQIQRWKMVRNYEGGVLCVPHSLHLLHVENVRFYYFHPSVSAQICTWSFTLSKRSHLTLVSA